MTILRAGSRLFCHDERKNSSHPFKCRPRMAGEVCHRPYEGDAIGELRPALVDAGHLTLGQQTESLGLGRSTAWAVLQGNHKHSGLSAATINRMLASQLPRPREKYFWSTSRRNWRALMGRTKRSFASFVVRLPRLSKFIVAARQATPRRAAFIHPGTSAGLDL
jgi:hypothetical protein